jgi:hypothetical protein
VAVPGDTVLVHGGVYREWVKPAHAGLSDTRRITYRAAPGQRVVIKGSEVVSTWVPEGRGVWRAELDNSLFGEFNPFATTIDGDWMVFATKGEPRKHLGEVYLDGVSFFEVTSREALDRPAPSRTRDEWTGQPVPLDPWRAQRRWYASVDGAATTVWADFGEADPNAALVEVNVRRSVFYPAEHGIDFITVSGFEMAQAASPYCPPTADQPGLVGPNWAKGWIIEDNTIHDAKCSAVSIGKEASTGDNWFTKRLDKPGYQYQLEAVFAARHIGWSRERIGSHIIRRNTIFNCGQNAIVGHLGGVFSRIEDNHIYNIGNKHEWYGYEIAGIKLHAAIDVEIRHNLIHDCSLGTWLDWQAQGTRLTGNVYYHNNRDVFIEVSHGPYLADHNVFASSAALELQSQGGAFVHNLIVGTVRVDQVLDRATPYHLPHSTEVAGVAVVYGGDDRFVGNIFVGGGEDVSAFDYAYSQEGLDPPDNVFFGTAGYRGHPASFEEYLDLVASQLPGDDLAAVKGVKQPVYLAGNVYLAGAQPSHTEGSPAQWAAEGRAEVAKEEDGVYLEIDLPEGFDQHRLPLVTTAALARVRLVDADYENPDGSPLALDRDLVGAVRGGDSAAGPLVALGAGHNRVRIWPLG